MTEETANLKVGDIVSLNADPSRQSLQQAIGREERRRQVSFDVLRNLSLL